MDVLLVLRGVLKCYEVFEVDACLRHDVDVTEGSVSVLHGPILALGVQVDVVLFCVLCDVC